MFRRVFTILILSTVLSAAACGGSSPATAPTQPSVPTTTPTPPAPPATPPPIVLTGRVVATVAGTPLPGVALELGGQTVTTDASGTFRVELPPGGATVMTATLSGASIVTHRVQLLASASRDLTLDAIQLTGGFDLEYYRRLVRNDLEDPGVLYSLRRQLQSPKVYLKTVDEAGQPIDPVTLETVAGALVEDSSMWTGGRFRVAEVVRGTETRLGQSGWLTVRWLNPGSSGFCAQAQVGIDGGYIEFNHLNNNCACGSSRVGPSTVWHELGHSFGFWHTGNIREVMGVATNRDDFCRLTPTPRERFHAAIAYSRPIGNKDEDDDPAFAIQSGPTHPVLVVD